MIKNTHRPAILVLGFFLLTVLSSLLFFGMTAAIAETSTAEQNLSTDPAADSTLTVETDEMSEGTPGVTVENGIDDPTVITPDASPTLDSNSESTDSTATESSEVQNAPNSATTSGQTLTDSTYSKIAFTSYRDGNAEIYLMNTDGSGQTNITNNPAFDLEPAWSPDGTRIAFASSRDYGTYDIYVMNTDGSHLTNLTNNPLANDGEPAWSPDGSMIAFVRNHEIYVMNADGSEQVDLTNNPAFDVNPAWSPDGTKIAFASERDHFREIYVMNSDGSGPTNLTNNPSDDTEPAWSPDGTRIAFTRWLGFPNYEVYAMNADGTDQTNLTNNPSVDGSPTWSPDGARIAFVNHSDRDNNGEIYVMNADGSGVVRLTNNPAIDWMPAWSPAFATEDTGDEAGQDEVAALPMSTQQVVAPERSITMLPATGLKLYFLAIALVGFSAIGTSLLLWERATREVNKI